MVGRGGLAYRIRLYCHPVRPKDRPPRSRRLRSPTSSARKSGRLSSAASGGQRTDFQFLCIGQVLGTRHVARRRRRVGDRGVRADGRLLGGAFLPRRTSVLIVALHRRVLATARQVDFAQRVSHRHLAWFARCPTFKLHAERWLLKCIYFRPAPRYPYGQYERDELGSAL